MNKARTICKTIGRTTAIFLFGTASASAIDLSYNIENVTSGTESASGARWLCASFGTGPASHTLTSATLLLANPVAGTAVVSIYSNGGLEPGTLVGTLTSPLNYPPTLAETTFASTGIALSANTTYWLVLRATSGTFNWAWTSDNTGTGVGFQHTWGVSEDGGAFWWSFDIYPTQFRVTADACGAAPGDVNADGSVDGVDIQAFVACAIGGGSNCACADLSNNGSVGAEDAALLASRLLQ